MDHKTRYLPSTQTVFIVVRTASLCAALYLTISITFSWRALAALMMFLVTTYGVRTESKPAKKLTSNPFKGKPKQPSLSEKRETEVALAISRFVTSYDAEQCAALDSFRPIKQGSECIFASKARLWAADDWNAALSLEENIFRSVPMFLKFTLVCQELGLDGFLFLLPANVFGTNPQMFGQGVRQVLQTLSNLDPAGAHCMDKSYIGKRGWVFEFNRATFFITTFAPFYPSSHSRFAFGAEECFLLLQPEISFAQHDLPSDTPNTNWDHPSTVRDRIRIAFRDAGRRYKIRNSLIFPMAHDIVKPVREEVDPLVEWWVKDS